MKLLSKFTLKRRFKFNNLKNDGLIKTGNIISIVFVGPNFRKFSKNVLSKYQLTWNLFGAEKKYRFKKNYKMQNFFCAFALKLFKQYWKVRVFLNLVFYSSLSSSLRTLIGIFKVKKVIISFFCYLVARNIMNVSCIKNTGLKFKRKSLNFMVSKYLMKLRRLNPLRRMHKKKRNNR